MNYTLITGACKGIGKAMAYECASRKMNVLLVSNDHKCLMEVNDDIAQANGVKSHCLTLDLMTEGATGRVYEWIRDNKYQVNMLINNVGLGKNGAFGKMCLKDIHHVMTLNNKVLVEMTHYFIAELERNSPSYLLNISSLEATLPLPYKAVYTASKNFTYAFSLAIRQELKFSKTHVSVLCPGPVLTNTEGINRMNAHGKRSKLLMMYPEEVARIGINGVLKGKQVIVPGFMNAFFFKLGSLIPVGLKMHLLERLFRVYKN